MSARCTSPAGACARAMQPLDCGTLCSLEDSCQAGSIKQHLCTSGSASSSEHVKCIAKRPVHSRRGPLDAAQRCLTKLLMQRELALLRTVT